MAGAAEVAQLRRSGAGSFTHLRGHRDHHSPCSPFGAPSDGVARGDAVDGSGAARCCEARRGSAPTWSTTCRRFPRLPGRSVRRRRTEASDVQNRSSKRMADGTPAAHTRSWRSFTREKPHAWTGARSGVRFTGFHTRLTRYGILLQYGTTEGALPSVNY